MIIKTFEEINNYFKYKTEWSFIFHWDKSWHDFFILEFRKQRGFNFWYCTEWTYWIYYAKKNWDTYIKESSDSEAIVADGSSNKQDFIEKIKKEIRINFHFKDYLYKNIY